MSAPNGEIPLPGAAAQSSVQDALSAMLHPHAHLDAASPRYHRFNFGRALVYSVVAGMTIGSLFMPLIDNATGNSNYYYYSYLTYFKVVTERYDHSYANSKMVHSESSAIADSTCLTFRLRMQAGAAMAILSIISSLLTALFAVSDAGLVGCSCLVSAMGPRGFGTVSAVISLTAFTALVAAFGIIIGHYHAKNPCDFSYTSMSQSDSQGLASGIIITIFAFIFIVAIEALRFLLIRAAWLPPSKEGPPGADPAPDASKGRSVSETAHALINPYGEFSPAEATANGGTQAGSDGQQSSASGSLVRVAVDSTAQQALTVARLVAHVVVFALALASLIVPLFGTEERVDNNFPYRVVSKAMLSFWQTIVDVTLYTYDYDKRDYVRERSSSSTAAIEDLGCVADFAHAAAAFVIIGAVCALVTAVLSCLDMAPLRRAMSSAGPSLFVNLARAAALADVCCFVCMWLGFILATDMFYGARCNGQLALANRGFRIAPYASASGYVFLVLAAVASAVIGFARAVAYFCGVAPVGGTPTHGGTSDLAVRLTAGGDNNTCYVPLVNTDATVNYLPPPSQSQGVSQVKRGDDATAGGALAVEITSAAPLSNGTQQP